MKRAVFEVARPRATALRALNYIPAVEKLRSMRGGSGSVPLHSLLMEMGKSYGSVFTRLDCRPPNGIELLSQTDMFATEPTGRRIRLDSMPNPEGHEVKGGQLLLAGAGTLGETELYGRGVLADSRLVGKYVGPDAMVLEFREPSSDDALCAYAFLSTQLGVHAIRSTSYGTKILRFRTDVLRELPIPVLPVDLRRRVADLVRSAVANRERESALRTSARLRVASLPSFAEAVATVGQRSRKAVRWEGELPTMRGWTYASAGEALSILRRQSSAQVRDYLLSDGLFQGPRFARIPCQRPFGVDLLSQRDVFMARRIPQRIAKPGVVDAELFPARDALLLACDGQLSEGTLFGHAELAASVPQGTAVSEHILRMNPRDGSRGLLYAYLSSILGYRLLQSTAVGTSIPKMRLDLVAALPVPSVPKETEVALHDIVTKAADARANADHAEAEAIGIIENEVIPAWLN